MEEVGYFSRKLIPLMKRWMSRPLNPCGEIPLPNLGVCGLGAMIDMFSFRALVRVKSEYVAQIRRLHWYNTMPACVQDPWSYLYEDDPKCLPNLALWLGHSA